MEPETILRILNAGLSAAVDESRGPGQGARITLAAIDESIAKHTDPIARDFQRGQIVLFDLLKRGSPPRTSIGSPTRSTPTSPAPAPSNPF